MIFLILGLLLFIPTLKYHYICDDLAVLDATERNKTPIPKNKLDYLWRMFRGDAYWADSRSKALAHRITTLHHFFVCCMIYFVFGKTPLATVAAILFMINPTNTEVSVWLSGQAYGTTTFFSLVSWGIPVLAPFIFMFTPEAMIFYNGLFFPVVFLLYPGYEYFALITVVLLLKRYKDMFDKKKGKLSGYAKNKYALQVSPWKVFIAVKFYGYYLANNILGLKYSLYQSYMDDYLDTTAGIKKSKRIDAFFFIGLAGIATLIYLLITDRTNIITIGLFWATINIAMWCNFIMLGQQYVSNRQAYLANVGLMVAVAGVVIHYPYIAGVLIGWYIRQFIIARKQYTINFWQFFYGIVDEPEFYYHWINYGTLFFHRQEYKAALSSFTEANGLRPNNFKVLFNISGVYLALNNLKKSIEYLELSRKADVYAQEKRRDQVVQNRMNLINKIIQAKGTIQLNISEIEMVV